MAGDASEPYELTESMDAVGQYLWAVSVAFGHPDEYGLEMSHPTYRTHVEEERKESSEIYNDDVDILIDGYTAQEDALWLWQWATVDICETCGWVTEQCCCDRLSLRRLVGTGDPADQAELANLRAQADAFEVLVRRRVRRRTALLRWAFLRRVVGARSVVVYWIGEAAKRACAPGGPGREADAAAFANEFV